MNHISEYLKHSCLFIYSRLTFKLSFIFLREWSGAVLLFGLSSQPSCDSLWRLWKWSDESVSSTERFPLAPCSHTNTQSIWLRSTNTEELWCVLAEPLCPAIKELPKQTPALINIRTNRSRRIKERRETQAPCGADSLCVRSCLTEISQCCPASHSLHFFSMTFFFFPFFLTRPIYERPICYP